MQDAFKSSLCGAYGSGTSNEHKDVHFHVHSVGRPYVCDYARCDSPGLTAEETELVDL